MKILFLGNSFTFVNDLPAVVAALLDADVSSHTRGGARLAEQLNPETTLGAKTLSALRDEAFDYVVLQEQSFAPVGSFDSFLKSVKALCALIRENGATPLLYATWAYREGSEKLQKTGYTYCAMDEALSSAYHKAAEETGALVADAGKAFTALRSILCPYQADDYHPSEVGTMIAAHAIVNTILKNEKAL